ncbi:MAG TPA: aldolase/citrate lyase family protein [Acidimicrobiales bacterium]|nr:aldolase/citrate lyase family protein [Acidimicrobiales bacterium]
MPPVSPSRPATEASGATTHELDGELVDGELATGGGLRRRLRSSSPLVATFVMMPRIEIVEMAAASGFDAVVLDLEHGAVSVEELPQLCAAGSSAGIMTLARLATGGESEIARALDMGVDGIIVPHVSSPAIAAQVAAAGRFPPSGSRSLNPYVRGLRYGRQRSGALAEADARTALVVMIEGADAVGAIDEIGDVPGIDALFVGPVDLAGTLGFPGEPERPEVVALVREVLGELRRRGVPSAIYAPDAGAAGRWLAEGASLVVVSADHAMVMDAFSSLRREIARFEPHASSAPGTLARTAGDRRAVPPRA